MRPITRGCIPKSESGTDYIPKRYQAYRGYLIERIGNYCSYCERPMSHSIAVEHIQPKTAHADLEVTWSNLLLCCTNCNSTKGRKDVRINEYFWPDIDNTAKAFIYSSAGSIRPNNSLTKELLAKSLKTIELTGLDKEPSDDLKRNPEVTDRRWTERRTAWERADRAKQRLRQNDTSFMREQIIDTALEKGFFSIWMTVFQDDLEMKKALVTSFSGTALDCYDASYNYLHRKDGSI